jgi:hypothetical protein
MRLQALLSGSGPRTAGRCSSAYPAVCLIIIIIIIIIIKLPN